MTMLETKKGPIEVPISSVISDPLKLREVSDEIAAEMAQNIKQNGHLQPILVRPISDGSSTLYKVVFGEHRFKAAKLLNHTSILCYVQQLDDLTSIELKLSENIQRNIKVDPVIEGQLFQKLINERYGSANQLAIKLGKSVGYINGRIGLSGLDQSIKDKIGKGITVTEAVALSPKSVEDQLTLARMIEERKAKNVNPENLQSISEGQPNWPESRSSPQPKEYRGEWEIIGEMLEIYDGKHTRTAVMYKAYLSYSQLKEYEVRLETDGLIKREDNVFIRTKLGAVVLNLCVALRMILKDKPINIYDAQMNLEAAARMLNEYTEPK